MVVLAKAMGHRPASLPLIRVDQVSAAAQGTHEWRHTACIRGSVAIMPKIESGWRTRPF
jgi:hypothetical protein